MLRHHRLFTLAVLATLAACDDGDSPVSPSEAPSNQTVAALTSPRIALRSNLTGNGDIYLMDSYGKQVSRLTSFAGTEGAPAWSWNNKRIAMVRPRKDASNSIHHDIYIINADGTHGHWWRPTPSQFNIDDPSWSPDGAEILVTATVEGTRYVAHLNLAGQYCGFFTDEVSNIVTGLEPSFSPAGDQIVYAGYDRKTLNVMGAAGYQHKTLLYNPQSSIGHPVFSPDGKRIALEMTDTDGILQVFVRGADASLQRLTSTVYAALWPSWSPDGSKIAFQRSNQIWTMTATGGNQTKLHVSSYDVAPGFSH